MMVTALEPFRNGKVSVYLDEEFAFVLYKGELSKYNIKIGTNIDDAVYARIFNEVLIPRCKKRGMNLLMKMDRTESDVRNKLSESGYPIEAIDASIEYLKSFRYVDDNRYAGEYIRCKINSLSRKMIIKKLTEKGISQDIIFGELDKYDADSSDFDTIDNESNDPQMQLILKLINKRLKGAVDISYDSKQKLYAYLYNKGFSVDEIGEALDEYISANYNS